MTEAGWDWPKLHSDWMELGLEPGRFWKLTPAEIAREMKAMLSRHEREQDNRAWLAWHVAALGRSKKMPKLQELLGNKKKRRAAFRRQSAEVLFTNMKAVFLAFGGDPKELAQLKPGNENMP